MDEARKERKLICPDCLGGGEVSPENAVAVTDPFTPPTTEPCARCAGKGEVAASTITAGERRILATYECPPVPVRDWDWSAIDDDTYDGALDSRCPVGTGATREEAVANLLEQMNQTEVAS